MTNDSAQQVPHGVHRLFWVEGGSSLASVGYDAAGNTWYAPANWISGLPGFDWSKVDHVLVIAMAYREPPPPASEPPSKHPTCECFLWARTDWPCDTAQAQE